MEKFHHTTEISALGKCLICGKPILMYWEDAKEKTGQSERFKEKKEGVVHHSCINGLSLQEINEKRKKEYHEGL